VLSVEEEALSIAFQRYTLLLFGLGRPSFSTAMISPSMLALLKERAIPVPERLRLSGSRGNGRHKVPAI
jgi:hypothetical protein